jgi:hypothetical protein
MVRLSDCLSSKFPCGRSNSVTFCRILSADRTNPKRCLIPLTTHCSLLNFCTRYLASTQSTLLSLANWYFSLEILLLRYQENCIIHSLLETPQNTFTTPLPSPFVSPLTNISKSVRISTLLCSTRQGLSTSSNYLSSLL